MKPVSDEVVFQRAKDFGFKISEENFEKSYRRGDLNTEDFLWKCITLVHKPGGPGDNLWVMDHKTRYIYELGIFIGIKAYLKSKKIKVPLAWETMYRARLAHQWEPKSKQRRPFS